MFTIKDGKKEGKEIEYFQGMTEIKSSANYVNGVLDGEQKAFSFGFEGDARTSTVVTSNYALGVLDGVQTEETVYKYSQRDNSLSGKGPKTAGMIKMAAEGRKKRNTTTITTEYDKGVKTKERIVKGYDTTCEMVYKNGIESEGFRKYRDGNTEIEYKLKDGEADYICREYDVADWLLKKKQYHMKDGKLDGFYKEFNRDDILIEQKRYKDGKDVTAKYELLKKSAARNVSPEKNIVTPKQSQTTKIIVGLKNNLRIK